MAKPGDLPVFLKSISIQGFKSFADKIKLELGHGLSVIVGPNGSGKSNIADAVRWVLGEQSAKNLRGGKMEDIIFAGSAVRRPVGMAEVSLVFDNTTGIFPLDFQEVTITRRVYRDGEGQFFINRVPCRLKDIHELFMDTGAGKEGFSMIGQGRVEEILNLKSEERRVLIEEASGITKYRLRKREALKRLDETEQNLARLEDILREIEGQLTPLAEQARVAEQSLRLSQEQKRLEIQIVVQDLQGVRAKLNLSGQEADNVRVALAQVLSEIGQLEAQLLEDKVSLSRLEEKIQSQQEENYRIEQGLHNLTQELRVRQERAGYFKEQMAQVNHEIESNEGKRRLTEERITALEGKKAILEQTVNEAKQTVRNEECLLAEVKARGGSEEIDDLKLQATKLLHAQTEASQAYQKAEQALLLVQEQQQRLLSEKRDKETQRKQVEQQVQAFMNNIRMLEEQQEENLRTLGQLESTLQEIAQAMSEEEPRFAKLGREIDQLQARHHALKSLEDSLEGYQRGVRELMLAKKKNGNQFSGLWGTVADLIQVEKRYEVAIETALGAGLQNLVTETENDAKAAVQYLKRNQLGRATFLPLDVIQGGRAALARDAENDPGFIGIAVDLVSVDDRFRPALEFLLGRILVVKDMDAATRIARASGYRARIVTLDGDQVHPGGSLTGGSLQRKGANLLGRSRELQELSQSLATRRQMQKELEQKVLALSRRRKDHERERKDLADAGQKLNEQLAIERTHLKNAQEQLARLYKEIAILDQRDVSLAREAEKLSAQKQSLAKELREITARVDVTNQNLTAQEQKVRAATKEAEEIQERLTEAKVRLAKWEQELSQAKERLQYEQSALLELKAFLQEKLETRLSLEGAEQMLIQEQREFERQHAETAERLQQSQASLLWVRREREALSASILEQEKSLQQKRQEQQSLEHQLHALELRTARWETEWEAGLHRLQEEFALSWEEVQNYQMDTERQALWARMQEIKREIEALGPVNQAAIEEYPKLVKRFEFLNAQKQDLVEANQSLHALIRELDKTMSERFAEGFKAVNEAFRDVFKELFNGGNAELRLDDPDNLLETGVEIIAQPPGKKPQLLSLLSGGERALTAIALLFALLRVKPSPFCILDEIEASLDDANVSRFAQYIHKLSHSTQFLVISHRKGTMEAADVLYGVSMEESGVSKLLSVQLEEQEGRTA